jgi:hypothetical protein
MCHRGHHSLLMVEAGVLSEYLGLQTCDLCFLFEISRPAAETVLSYVNGTQSGHVCAAKARNFSPFSGFPHHIISHQHIQRLPHCAYSSSLLWLLLVLPALAYDSYRSTSTAYDPNCRKLYLPEKWRSVENYPSFGSSFFHSVEPKSL